MALSGATTPGQSGPGSNSNEGVLRIPQSPSISGTSPSDCLVSFAIYFVYATEELSFLGIFSSSRCLNDIYKRNSFNTMKKYIYSNRSTVLFTKKGKALKTIY